MDAKQYQKLPAGAKVTLYRDGETAKGEIVKKLESTSRKRFYASRVVVTEAAADGRWAKYLGLDGQDFHFSLVWPA